MVQGGRWGGVVRQDRRRFKPAVELAPGEGRRQHRKLGRVHAEPRLDLVRRERHRRHQPLKRPTRLHPRDRGRPPCQILPDGLPSKRRLRRQLLHRRGRAPVWRRRFLQREVARRVQGGGGRGVDEGGLLEPLEQIRADLHQRGAVPVRQPRQHLHHLRLLLGVPLQATQHHGHLRARRRAATCGDGDGWGGGGNGHGARGPRGARARGGGGGGVRAPA